MKKAPAYRRKLYSQRFKKDAVAAATAPGASRPEVALRMNVNDQVLARWIREKYGSSRVDSPLVTTAAPSPAATPPSGELDNLRSKLAYAVTERDLLKGLLSHYLLKGN